MKVTDIKIIGVIGAGQMGSGIAQVAAATGFRALLCDVNVDLAARAKHKIGTLLERQVAKGKLTEEQKNDTLSRIETVGGPASLAECDYVIEAATENVELKLKILRDADANMKKKDAILASNTSSISITKLAAAVGRSSQVVGMHFMNPVPVMKLVEIVRGVQTTQETYETTRDLAKTLGKTIITSTDRPGFVVNRVLIPFLNEACLALEEATASAEDIDQGVRLGLNHPMGPLELADLIGLDTVLSIAEVLHRDFSDSKYRPAVILRNLVAAGWLGKKTGRGFYVYNDKGEKQNASL